MAYDVAIIGAGMSGLAAGIRLAYYDKKVCILEKHSKIGGLNSYYVKGGYRLDVGLHAMTNYVSHGGRDKPMKRLLRQLRIGYDELNLSPQIRSAIRFGDTALYFTNDFPFLLSQIADKFPHQIDGFAKLLAFIKDYNELDLSIKAASTRELLGTYISDSLLTDMLLCPLMFYGNAKQGDMDLWQFVIMFKSIFLEGFARPYKGVRRILDILEKRFADNGGQLLLKKGVKRIVPEPGGAIELELEDGEVIKTGKVISSAGYLETMNLCGEKNTDAEIQPGVMSFMESIYILDKPAADFGIDDTITFFNSKNINSKNRFEYQKPDTLIDEMSGVICCPDNFDYDTPLNENIVRITNMSNSDLWDSADKETYRRQKEDAMRLSRKEAARYTGDFSSSIIFRDSFTPATIKRYTGHINGAVYGVPDKVRTGMTDIPNLFICGSDQGFLGIVGAMLSGITVANLYALK